MIMKADLLHAGKSQTVRGAGLTTFSDKAIAATDKQLNEVYEKQLKEFSMCRVLFVNRQTRHIDGIINYGLNSRPKVKEKKNGKI